MADKVVNRKVSIYLETGSAEQGYNVLLAKQKNLEAELAKNPKNAAALKRQLDQLVEPLERARKKMAGELSPSVRDLTGLVNQLGRRLRQMSQEDADYSKVLKQYDQAKAALKQLKAETDGVSAAQKSFGSQVRAAFSGFTLAAVAIKGLQLLRDGFNAAFQAAVKLSDQLADIQRVTGLTKTEVVGLNRALLNIDTRTSGEALRDIAVVSGKLGVAKQDILGFVQAVDKLSVALGDELGDVDQITTELGKILNVFSGKVTGDNITLLGNAIVDLANKGVASGPYIVDFAQRVSGIAKASNVSLPAVLGLAAGLEESGQRSESSSTAIQKLITTIAQDLPKAAKIAGATTEAEINKFIELFATKPEEAIVSFAEGLQKNKASFAEVASAFKDAGEEGVRVISTIAAIGQRADFFREKISEAGVAIQNTNAINDAFALKNETLAGSFDKLSKVIDRLVSNSGLTDFLKTVIGSVTDLINPTASATEKFDQLDGQVKALETDMVPLLKRHDELKAKTVLSKDEQEELRKIIKRVADQVPFAVTAFDEYGNALSISTGRVYEFIEAEKARLKVVNKDAIQENQKQLDQVKKQIAAAKKDLDQLSATGSFTVTEFTGGTGGGAPSSRKANEKEVRAKQDLYKALLDQQRGYNAEIKRLNGEAIQEQVDAAKEAGAQQKAAAEKQASELAAIRNKSLKELRKELSTLQGSLGADPKKDPEIQAKIALVQARIDELRGKKSVFEKEVEKAEKDFDKAFDALKEWQRAQAAANEGQMQREINQATEKYLVLQKKLQGHHAELKQLETTYQNEVFTIIAKYNQKDVDEFVKRMKAQEDALQKFIENTGKLNLPTTATDLFNRDEKAKKDLALMKTFGVARINEQLRQLEEERQAVLGSDKLTQAEREKAELEFQKRKGDLERGRFDEYVKYFQAALGVLSVLDKVKTDKENADLERDRRINDEKKNNLAQRLKAGTISQQQYDAEVQKIEKQQEARQRDAYVKQFKRQQRLRMGEALVDGYKAVTKTLGEFGPPLPPNFLGIAAMALTVGTVAAQISGILKAKPPEFARGGKLQGRSHSEGGMPVLDHWGRKVAEVEGGEGIANKRTMADGRRYSVTGTPSQIISSLNALHGGVHWQRGATVRPAWMTTQPLPVNFGAIRQAQQRYALGGVFDQPAGGNGADGGAAADNGAALQVITGVLADLSRTVKGLNAQLAAGIKANTYLSEQEAQQDRMAAIRADATFKG